MYEQAQKQRYDEGQGTIQSGLLRERAQAQNALCGSQINKQQSEVDRELSRLRAGAESLHQQIGRLANQLSSLLPQQDYAPNCAPEEACVCQHATELQMLSNQVSAAIGRLSRLSSDLCI